MIYVPLISFFIFSSRLQEHSPLRTETEHPQSNSTSLQIAGIPSECDKSASQIEPTKYSLDLQKRHEIYRENAGRDQRRWPNPFFINLVRTGISTILKFLLREGIERKTTS
jgi:hypothetical protein